MHIKRKGEWIEVLWYNATRIDKEARRRDR